MAKKGYYGARKGIDKTTARRLGAAGGSAATYGALAAGIGGIAVGPVGLASLTAAGGYAGYKAVQRRQGHKARTARQREASKRNLAKARARRKRRH